LNSDEAHRAVRPANDAFRENPALRDGNAMLRDSAYFLSAILSLAIILGWLSFLTLAMQASGPF
jgi:hypothetical protein